MKATNYFILLATILFITSCLPSHKRDKSESEFTEEQQEQIDQISSLIGNIDNNDDGYKDTTDYSKLVISKDSLNIKLYELVENGKSYNQKVLLDNIDVLIKKGAKPDVLVRVSYSVRKTGSYIPIIKHFYKNKYRNYTTATTAVHAAVGNGNIKVIKKLIDHGASIDIANKDRVYPIDLAIKNDDLKMINFLIEAGCNLKRANLGLSENTSLIEKLVRKGANPKTIDINYALEDRRTLKRLLALNPSIDDVELDLRVLMNDDELLDLLLDNGMSPNAMGTFPDRCPLIFAAIRYGNFRAVKKLHALGANLKEQCKGGFGDTPLQTAIYYQNIDALNYLLENKVSPNERDWTKKSALILACGKDNDQIIKTLIKAGAKIEYNGYFNKTPLMHAVQYNKYIAAQTLIDHKANVNYRNKYGETCLSVAISENDFALVKLLVENGAKVNIKVKNLDLVNFAKYKEASPMVVSYLEEQLNK